MKPYGNCKISRWTTSLIIAHVVSLLTITEVECGARRGLSSRMTGCENVVLKQPKKYISSPNSPKPSYPNTRCSWTVQNPNNRHVAIRPVSLRVGGIKKDDDTRGFLEIYDGCGNDMFLVENITSLETSRTVNNRFQEGQPGYLWISTRSCLTIKFDSVEGNGNKFLLTFEETTDVCGGTMQSNNGSIAIPHSLHSSEKECVWIISVPSGYVELQFDEFDVTSNLKRNDRCKMDFVKVQNGRSSSSAEIIRFCGKSRPYPVISSGQNLRITLTSVGEVAKKKLRARYRRVDSREPSASSKPCGGEMKQDKATFTTPNYGEQYPKNLYCVWKIEVPNGYRVKLKFRVFDIEPSEPSQGDCVEVFDGLASWASSIDEFCGRIDGQLPPVVHSTGNKMRIVFRSDEKYGGKGFEAEYAAFDPNAKSDDGSASHFTGIMIGTTCGIIIIVLTVLAVAHTRKLRLRRAQIRRTDVASSVSFDHDVHQLNAPPSYETVMSDPDRYPNTPRQNQRSYINPMDHREISHLLGSEDEDDEPPPPPYPGIVGQPVMLPPLLEAGSISSLPPGYPSQDIENTESKHELEDQARLDNMDSQIWQIRRETRSGSSESAFLLSRRNSERHTENSRDDENRKEDPRRPPPPPLERQDTCSSFVTDV